MAIIIIVLLFELPLIILSLSSLSLIVKVPQFFKNFTILSFTMALGAHMYPYSYMYCAPHRDGMLHSKSKIDEQFKILQENTQKHENKLYVSIDNWEQHIKIGKCQNKISKNYIK